MAMRLKPGLKGGFIEGFPVLHRIQVHIKFPVYQLYSCLHKVMRTSFYFVIVNASWHTCNLF